jgi:uncharacterized phage protein (TIGR02218 family)
MASGMQSLLESKTHRFANCWKVTRQDNEVFLFTDHDTDLVLSDGQTYTPTNGGLSASSIRKESGLKEQNVENNGILNSDAITADDLRAGRYRGAEVYQYKVNWLVPWMGAYETIRYWIISTSFDGEQWKAECMGLTKWLRHRVGEIVTRDCRHKVYDGKCGLTKGSYADTGSVTSITTERLKFVVSGDVTVPDAGYFDYGELVWDTGDNAGLTSEVLLHTKSPSVELELILPTPFDIAGADTFTVYAGCDLLFSTCVDKFANGNNHGGFLFVPGQDRAMASPNAK